MFVLLVPEFIYIRQDTNPRYLLIIHCNLNSVTNNFSTSFVLIILVSARAACARAACLIHVGKKINSILKEIPRGELYPCLEGKKPENKSKNRYTTIFPCTLNNFFINRYHSQKYVCK